MLKTKKEIKDWLTNMGINDYTIHDDLTVDVYDSIDLKNNGLKDIPVQFGKAVADFDISSNSLTNLKGCPFSVGGNFVCFYNPLYSLKYCPKEIKGSFYLRDTLIENLRLEDLPDEIGYYLILENNKFIENLFEDNKTSMYKLKTIKSALLNFNLNCKIKKSDVINKKIKI